MFQRQSEKSAKKGGILLLSAFCSFLTLNWAKGAILLRYFAASAIASAEMLFNQRYRDPRGLLSQECALFLEIVVLEVCLSFVGPEIAFGEVSAIGGAEFRLEPGQQFPDGFVGFEHRLFRRFSAGKQTDGHDPAAHSPTHTTCSC
jgi:hypothetical protein